MHFRSRTSQADIGVSYEAASCSSRQRPGFRARLPIFARTISCERIDGCADAVAGLSEDGRHIGGERTLQRLRCHERIVGFLESRQSFSVYEQRLSPSPLQLACTGYETLDRIGDIVRLIEHVRGVEVGDVAPLRIGQLVEYEE